MKASNSLLYFVLAVEAAVASAADQSVAEELSLLVGGSAIIDSPADVVRISTTDPTVVDTVAVNRREVLLQAKGYGLATVGIWLKTGGRAFYKVTVLFDLEPVRKLLKQTFPNEAIEVQGVRDSVSLTGRVSNQAVADRAAALAAPLAKSVVNNLLVSSVAEKQVMLRVKFAELDRTAAASFGVNLASIGAGNTIGRTTTGQFAAPQPDTISSTESKFTISDALNIFAFRPDLNLAAFIEALKTQGVLQILAEPNLVTSDGKEASFLVGGEFPVPVVQGGAGVGTVTVMFREFGIRLTFQPQITPNRTIKLHVKPEVSMLDPANGVVLAGFNIPALSMRRMETNIELAEGQSFAIAGLVDDRVSENLSKVPGLSNIPVLGALFKSRHENKTKTELVVLVTPEIVDPSEAARLAPEPVMPKEFLKKPKTEPRPAAAKKGRAKDRP
jgi:pilus assembly protein CpaC